jgi:hypothetical protein
VIQGFLPGDPGSIPRQPMRDLSWTKPKFLCQHSSAHFDVIHPAVCRDLNTQHRAFRPTQPAFNNYLYTTCFSNSIIRCTIQKLKIQGKSTRIFSRDLTNNVVCIKYTIHVTIGFLLQKPIVLSIVYLYILVKSHKQIVHTFTLNFYTLSPWILTSVLYT